MTSFDRCYASLIKSEGGYVNNPKDPGGVTNLGVTKRAWEAYLHRTVSIAEMKALTVERVCPFYRAMYWNAAHCDSLPTGLALCVFHVAVNAGVRRAAKLLQSVVGATPDGAIGPSTLAAVSVWTANHGERVAINAFQDALRAFYRSLSTFPTFGRGWINRSIEVQRQATEMAA